MAMMPDLAKRHGAAFTGYFFIGGASAAVEWLVFAALIGVAPKHYISAAAIAFIVATFANYLLCIGTIFSSRTRSALKDIAAVYLASLLAFLVNLSVLAVLVSLFRANPVASKVAGTGVAFLFNFAARRFVIFAPAGWMRSLVSRGRAAPAIEQMEDSAGG